MENISMNQALGIWSELWQAYYGNNGFGGDTAEIYAYRIMPYSPRFKMDPTDENDKAAGLMAAKSLYALLKKFSEDNECKIEIMHGKWNRREIRPWFIEEPFFHRCHVRVTKK